MKGYHHTEKGIGIVFDDIFIAGGVRTPFGKYCGTLAQISPTDLGIYAARGVFENNDISAAEIDQVITANIGQSSADAYFLPRHISLYSGIPISVPSLMVQRICGSGFESIITGAEQITLGKAKKVLCVGSENMSLSPTVCFGNRMGYPLGRPLFKDMLWEALDDTAAGYPMGFTAENIAKEFNISREECDEFAALSFARALKAKEENIFREEIVPMLSTKFEIDGLKPRKVQLPKGNESFCNDEHIRETTYESLSKLPTVFDKVGVLTAGNCSGIVDGAAAMLIVDRETALTKNIQLNIKLVAASSCGIDPKRMGLGPVPAIRLLLELSGLLLEDIGLFEINEAFSAQVIGCEKELGIDRNKLNVNGGAIAIGHPLAASGLRLTLTLYKELIRRNKKYGIAAACIGGGQGTAVLIENMKYKS
ncbi:MAG: thiolase family protein [Bacteroidetes bacterium]|jgi:acetyl-CoA C-acetyltransferase|nr:thiolase family protein [Bacteroidota bacterium]MBK9317722.1 thiolase family protein [Bacteroidota bacterium]MBK9400164.1 thiolase family protein [Bacteroidota bacterium]